MKLHCDVIRDLIPSYIDGICSEESKKIVEEHLEECKECQGIVNDLRQEQKNIEIVEEASDPWLKVKRKFILRNVIVFVLAPLICFSFYVGWCTLKGEGLSLDALLYRNEANEFMQAFSVQNYERASAYLSFYDSNEKEERREEWVYDMEKLDLEFSKLHWNQLYAEDGLVYDYVTCLLESGETLEFRLIVQGDGLALYSIYVHNNEELTEMYQEIMTTYYPG